MREYYAWERKQEATNETAVLNLIDCLICKSAILLLILREIPHYEDIIQNLTREVAVTQAFLPPRQ